MLGMVCLRMNLFVFLKILRTFEFLIADFAVVRLEWNMNAEVRGDVVPLGTCRVTLVLPLASKSKVISRLAANVVVAKVIVELFRVGEGQGAGVP